MDELSVAYTFKWAYINGKFAQKTQIACTHKSAQRNNNNKHQNKITVFNSIKTNYLSCRVHRFITNTNVCLREQRRRLQKKTNQN